MNNKILVLGGAGFLGQHILKELIKTCDFEVECGDIAPSGIHGIPYNNIDILNENELNKAIRNSDIIMNCIGQISHPIHYSYLLNTKGIKNIVASIKRYQKKLIHISSVSVYGTTRYADEESAIKPETSYATFKAFAEFIILDNLCEEDYIILRVSNLYGENQQKGLIYYLKKSFYSNKTLKFNNNGKLIRYFIHARDCSRIIKNIIMEQKLKGIFNLKGNDKYSIKNLVQLFENTKNMRFKVKYTPEIPLENINDLSDNKIKSAMNVSHEYTLNDYLKGL